MLNAFLFQWTHITDAQTQCSGIAYNLIPLPIGMVTPGLTIFVEKKDDVLDMHRYIVNYNGPETTDVDIKINWHIPIVLGQYIYYTIMQNTVSNSSRLTVADYIQAIVRPRHYLDHVKKNHRIVHVLILESDLVPLTELS